MLDAGMADKGYWVKNAGCNGAGNSQPRWGMFPYGQRIDWAKSSLVGQKDSRWQGAVKSPAHFFVV